MVDPLYSGGGRSPLDTSLPLEPLSPDDDVLKDAVPVNHKDK